VSRVSLDELAGRVVVEQAKGGQLVLSYGGGLPTSEEMTSFFVTQGPLTSLTEEARDDFESLWRGGCLSG